ncbi:hypothetical protein AAII07_38665 [Microvirga sp. 0TCS3.31]
MPSFRDLSEVAAHLTHLELPFVWYVMGPDEHAMEFEVAPRDCVTATDYFVEHPLVLADGTPVPVIVKPRRGNSWTSPPAEDASARDEEFDDESLVGLDVDEAAARANGAGWLVRAHEPEAMVTADLDFNRLNLCFGDDRVVESVSRG